MFFIRYLFPILMIKEKVADVLKGLQNEPE